MHVLDWFGPSERTLDEQLAQGEKVLFRTSRHVVSLWKPVLRALLASALWLWIVFNVPAPGRLLDAVTLTCVGLWAWVAWSEFERRHNKFVITDQRLLLFEGIIRRKIPMMRLSKVTDVTYDRSLAGRSFALIDGHGWGTIIIESAGQDQAMHDLTFLPEPDTALAELNGALFGRRAKERVLGESRNGILGRRRRGLHGPSDPGGELIDEEFTHGPIISGSGDTGSVLRQPERSQAQRNVRSQAIHDDRDVPPAGDWRAHRDQQPTESGSDTSTDTDTDTTSGSGSGTTSGSGSGTNSGSGSGSGSGTPPDAPEDDTIYQSPDLAAPSWPVGDNGPIAPHER